MRPLTLVTLSLVVVSVACAQTGAINAATMSPIRAMPAPAGATRYGNILFPGGTPSHPVALGGTISGSLPYTGVRPGGGGGMGRNRTVVVPYAVPVYAGGYGYGGYEPQPVQQPNITVVMPQQPTPTVVINNHYQSPDGPRTSVSLEEQSESTGGLKVYEANPRRAEAAPAKAAEPARAPTAYVRDDKPNIFLIALNDQSVKQAIGYWVKGDVLHFVTPQAKMGEVPLADVDRDASVKLNADRKLDFDLGIQ